jgi:WD40 repeat protein
MNCHLRHPHRLPALAGIPAILVSLFLAAGLSAGAADADPPSRGLKLPALLDHPGEIHCVAFSSNGKGLVSGSSDGTVRIWDLVTGQRYHTLKGSEGAVRLVAFAPDGKVLVTADEDGFVRRWNPGTGKETAAFRVAIRPVGAATLSPDGKILAVGAGPPDLRKKEAPLGGVKLFDTASGEERVVLKAAPREVAGLAFSPDGKTLAAGWPAGARLWDADTGKVKATLADDPPPAWPVAFSPDGKTLATGNLIDLAVLWDARARRRIGSVGGHIHWVMAVAFSPGGKRLATGSCAELKLWDSATGAALMTFSAGGTSVLIRSVAFSPDGKVVAAGFTDGSVRLWAVPVPKKGGK